MLVLLLALLAWWWLLEPLPEVQLPPRGAAPIDVAEPELSVLSLPIVLSLDEIEAAVAEHVPPVVVDEQGVPTGDATLVDFTVRRTGDVVATGGQAGAVRLQLPLSFEVRAYSARRASTRASKGKAPPQGVRAHGSLRLTVEQGLQVTEDWRMVSSTTLSHEWIEVPKVQLGPIQVGVRKLVDRQLAERWPELAAQLDAGTAERDETREKLAETWKQLSTPQPLGEPAMGWLVVQPESLFVSDPTVTDGAWRMTVGLTGRIRTSTELPESPPETPLPARTRPPAGEAGLQVSLPVHVGWETLTELARTELVGQEWPVSTAGLQAATVRVHEVQLYPSGTAVAAVLDYTVSHPGGTSEGTLAATATPELDAIARRLELVDFDYALRTDDSTIARPNAVVEEAVEAAVQERLGVPLGPKLDEARLQVNDTLAAGKGGPGHTMSGRLDTLEVRGLWLTDAALVVDTQATGALQLRLTELPEREGGARPEGMSPGLGGGKAKRVRRGGE